MNSTVVKVAGRDIAIRTLTVGEIRAWLRELGERPKDQPVDLIGETLFAGITLRELSLLTDLPLVSVEALTPADLAPLVDAFLAANPQWSECRGRIAALGATAR